MQDTPTTPVWKRLTATLLLVVWIFAYMLVAGVFGDFAFGNSVWWVRSIYYVVAGLAWVPPAMGLIWWGWRPPKPAA